MQNRTLKERQELETHDRLRYDLGEKEKDYLKAQIRMELFLTRNVVKGDIDEIYKDRYGGKK
jgi:hypothetical protein